MLVLLFSERFSSTVVFLVLLLGKVDLDDVIAVPLVVVSFFSYDCADAQALDPSTTSRSTKSPASSQ